MEWINKIPEELREKVREATKGMNLVDSKSGEWVPAAKISELTGKHKITVGDMQKEIDSLKLNNTSLQSKLDGFKDYEDLKSQVSTLTNQNEQMTLSNGLRDKLVTAGAAYPELLIKNLGELKNDMDFETVTNELKEKYPLSFKTVSTSGAGTGGQSKPMTEDEKRQFEINKEFNKPQKSFADFANILGKIKKE